MRADYGAIALVDSSTGSLRLRGAGPYSRLSSFDLDFSHPDACTVAPTSLLLHVNRTRRSITSVGQLQKLRQDPFYGDRLRECPVHDSTRLSLDTTREGRPLIVICHVYGCTFPARSILVLSLQQQGREVGVSSVVVVSSDGSAVDRS